MPTSFARSLVWVAVLLGCWARCAWVQLRGPLQLADAAAWPRQLGLGPQEHVGRGLACVEGGEPFSRWCGPLRCGRMSAARRLLIGAPLSLEEASANDLAELPGVGPVLAARIYRARSELAPDRGGVAAARVALARVRGLGARRAQQIATRLGLAETPRDDICSWGSWPTTSSGSDRPR